MSAFIKDLDLSNPATEIKALRANSGSGIVRLGTIVGIREQGSAAPSYAKILSDDSVEFVASPLLASKLSRSSAASVARWVRDNGIESAAPVRFRLACEARARLIAS